MPIAIWLKDPKVSILVKGEIDKGLKDSLGNAAKSGMPFIMELLHDDTGQPVLIPSDNVAMMQYLTDKEVEEAKEKAESDMKKRAAMAGGGGSGLVSPGMLIPSNRGGRSRR